MRAEEYQRVKRMLDQVMDLEPAERASMLERECAGDVELRLRVESLLAHLDEPAVDIEGAREELAQAVRRDVTSGPQVPGYRILEILGEGGMGVVYLAEQSRPHRRVALKVIRPERMSADAAARFEREANVLGRLQHPGVAQVFEVGNLETRFGIAPFIAMEYIDGPALMDYVRMAGLDTRMRLELMIRICRTVEYAHEQGVVHRDLKPSNILVRQTKSTSGSTTSSISDGPQTKVLDFGVARLVGAEAGEATLRTETGQLLGTVAYMSPEQIARTDAEVDRRSDVYALGVILCEVLTGRLPYALDGLSLPEAGRVIMDEEPSLPGDSQSAFRGDIDTIVAKALEKDPRRRYATAAVLADDLERVLNDQPITARPPSTLYQLRKFARRNRLFVGSTAAVMLTLLVAVVATTLNAREAQAQRLRAEDEAVVSQQVSAFLHDVLTAVNPLNATIESGHRRNITVREALDLAAPRLSEFDEYVNPRVLASLHRTLGLAYRAVGEHATAEPHLRQAYDLRHAHVGPRDPETLSAAHELVLVLVDLRRLVEGETLATESLAVARSSQPADSEELANLVSSRGIVAFWSGDLALAEQLGREHLAMLVRRFGPSHRRTLIAMSNLGLTLSEGGKLDEASELLSTCAEERARTLGENHLETIYARNNLANLLMRQGRMPEAAAIWDDVVTRARDVLGPAHPDWQAWLRNLALSHAMLGDVAHGIELLEASREFLLVDGANTHPGSIHHLGMLAMFLTEVDRLDEALPIIDQVHELSVQVFGPEHVETIRSLTLYYDLYEKQGNEAQMQVIADQLRGTPFDPANATE